MLRLGGGGPAKPITECDTIYIGLVRRVLSRIIYRAHEVMRILGWLPKRKSSASRSVSVVCVGASRVYVLRGKEEVVVTSVGCQDQKMGGRRGFPRPTENQVHTLAGPSREKFGADGRMSTPALMSALRW